MKNPDENYTFVRETIKKKPPLVLRAVIKILKFLTLGIAFGAGVVLVLHIFFNTTLKGLLPENESETEFSQKADEDVTTHVDENDNTGSEKTIEEIVSSKTVSVVTIRYIKTDEGVIQERSGNTGVIVQKAKNVLVYIALEKISGADNVLVSFDGGKTLMAAEIKSVDEQNDMAIISVNRNILGEELYNSISSVKIKQADSIAISQDVVYVGNPYGQGRLIYNAKVAGVDDGSVKMDTYYRNLITDISDSQITDGFIFDMDGRLIAAVSRLNNEHMEVNNVVGVCVSDINHILRSLIIDSDVKVIGIMGETVTDEMRELTQEKIPDGMYVTEVSREGSAFTAGIMVGDIIISFNNKKVESMKDVQKALENTEVNDTITIVLKRKIGTSYNEFLIRVRVEAK